MSAVNLILDWLQNLFDPVIDSGTPVIHVTNVLPVVDHILVLGFDNGDVGTLDLARHVEFRGTLAPLADVTYFKRVQVKSGTLWWPGDIQMDPTVLHQLTKENPNGWLQSVSEPPSPPPSARITGVHRAGRARRSTLINRRAQAPQRSSAPANERQRTTSKES